MVDVLAVAIPVSIVGALVLFWLAVKIYFKVTRGVYLIRRDLSDKTILITGASAGTKAKNCVVLHLVREHFFS